MMLKKVSVFFIGCLMVTSCILDVDSIVPSFYSIEDHGFGSECPFMVYATGPWRCVVHSDFENMTITPLSGDGDTEVILTIPENTTGKEHVSFLSFSCGEALTPLPIYHDIPGMNLGDIRYTSLKLKDGNWWTASNLSFLPNGKGVSAQNFSTNTGIWFACNPENGEGATSTNDIIKYGLLYSSDIISEICPEGWHLPSKAEWEKLIGVTSFIELDTLGFNLSPVGYVVDASAYSNAGHMAKYACDIKAGSDTQDAMVLSSDASGFNLGMGTFGNHDGVSVRCVRDVQE